MLHKAALDVLNSFLILGGSQTSHFNLSSVLRLLPAASKPFSAHCDFYTDANPQPYGSADTRLGLIQIRMAAHLTPPAST